MDKNQVTIKGLNEWLTIKLEERIWDYWHERNEVNKCSIDVVQEVEDNRQFYLWYGGEVAVIKYKGYTLSLAAVGDVEGILLDENGDEIVRTKDTGNNANFFWNMQQYFATDHEVMEAKDRGEWDDGVCGKTLALDYCNWWDVMVTDSKRNFVYDEPLDSELFTNAVIESIMSLDCYLEQESEEKIP